MDTEPKKKIVPARRKKWAVLPILDMYILREFLVPLTVLVFGFILLFLIGNIYDDLKELLENHAAFSVMLQYFFLRLPGNVRFILPISVLLACMYVMANFGKNMEIIAMRASGISLQRCCAAIYMIAILVTVLNFWFNEALVPESEKRAEVLRKSLGNEKYRYNIMELLTYRSPERRNTWFFKYFDINGIQKNVILKNYRDNNTLEWSIEAEEAEFFPGEGWEFRNGETVRYEIDGFLPGPAEPFASQKFSLNKFPERPEDIMRYAKPAQELSSFEIFEILRKTKNMAKSCRNVYETTLYSRLSFPWTCIIAVFLAIPLAARHERSGIFKSIVTGVAVMVAYQVISNMACILGNRGFVPPLLAGLGPTVAFIIYGIKIARQET